VRSYLWDYEERQRQVIADEYQADTVVVVDVFPTSEKHMTEKKIFLQAVLNVVGHVDRDMLNSAQHFSVTLGPPSIIGCRHKEKWQKDHPKAKKNSFVTPVTRVVVLNWNLLLDWDCLIWQRVSNIQGLLLQNQRKSWDRKEW